MTTPVAVSARKTPAQVAAAVRRHMAMYGQRDIEAIASDLGYGGKSPERNLERILYRAGALDLIAELLPGREIGRYDAPGAKPLIKRLNLWLAMNADEHYSARPSLSGTRVLHGAPVRRAVPAVRPPGRRTSIHAPVAAGRKLA